MTKKVRRETSIRTFRMSHEVDAMLEQLAVENYTTKTSIVHQLIDKEFKSVHGNIKPTGFKEEDAK